MSYQEDLRINKYELEDLWEDHQDRFINWSDQYADAIEKRDLKKEQLDYETNIWKEKFEQVKADLDLDIRINWQDKYELPKAPTESMVSQVMLSQPEFKEVNRTMRDKIHELKLELIELDLKVNKLKGAKEAFEHRKMAMDNLTRLMLGGYYSAKLPKEVREDVKAKQEEKIIEERRETLSESMQKRRNLKRNLD